MDKGFVQLVPENGPPRWHATATEFPVDFSVNADGHWLLKSWDFALVDLIGEMPAEHFKLRGEIKHTTSDQWGYVGLYVGRQAKTPGTNPIHLFCALTYNDVTVNVHPMKQPPVYLENPAKLDYHLLASIGKKDYLDSFGLGGLIKFPPDAQGRKWRVVEIEVSPSQIIGSFKGEVMKAVDHSEADRLFRNSIARKLKDPPRKEGMSPDDLRAFADSQFEPAGAIGLVVLKSTVAVKNVTVTRLPQ
jgi:hypothetical protein